MLKQSEMSLTEGIYTFIDPDTGKNTHIASTRLIRWVETHKSLDKDAFNVPIDRKMAAQFINNNVVSRQKCITLLTQLALKMIKDLPPIIFVARADGMHLLVDGHHRYVCAAAVEAPLIPAYILHPKEWEPFQVETFDLTEDELKAIPPGNFEDYFDKIRQLDGVTLIDMGHVTVRKYTK